MTERKIDEERNDMESGSVFPDRPMQSGRLFVPRDIRPDGEFLTWPWVPAGEKSRVTFRHAKPGMLADFIRLHDASGEKILAYARRWGVLGICSHGLPCSHNQYPYGLHDGIQPCLPILASHCPFPVDEPPAGPGFWLSEPLEAWRAWSRKAQSLMNIGARLNQGKIARVEDWRSLKDLPDAWGTEHEPFMEPETKLAEAAVATLANARAELGNELDGWISIGQVRPRISWQNDRARFSLDAVSSGPNLFGLLALNIAVAIASGDSGLAVCSNCGNSYLPSRRPDPNRRNFCEGCGKKAAQRDAARDYRQRQREK
jgi:hypothetical protein